MKVVGIVTGVSKSTGNPFTILHVVKDFAGYQVKDALGNAVDTLFVRGYVNVAVNDEIEPIYDVGYQGKAVIRSVTVIK